MTLMARAMIAFEAAPIPDGMRKGAVSVLVGHVRRKLANVPQGASARFAEAMRTRPIAENTDDANAQHYEVPADFFSA